MTRNDFTDEEFVEIMELARIALADADIFDDMAEKLDLSDAYMIKLRDKIEKFMGAE